MNGEPVRTWRTYADDEWARVSFDPLTVNDDELWPNEVLEAQTSRDTVLVVIAGMVIVAILAWLAGRASV